MRKSWLVYSGIIVITAAYCLLGIIRHNHFQSFGYDLGIFDQEVWLYSQFAVPFSTIHVPNMVILGDHFSPSLTLLAPLYFLWADARVLILAQALLIGLSAVPIYLLGRNFVIVVAYLLFFGIQNGLAFDFHETLVATALLPWLFYFLHEKRLVLYWLLFLVLLGIKEDVSLILFGVGIFSYLQYKDKKTAFFSMAISAIWLLVAIKVAIPHFSAGFAHDVSWPKTISEVATIFWPIDKWVTVFWSLFAFGFLPLLAPTTWPILGIHFLSHWIDPKYMGRWEMGMHYQAMLAPVLAMATIISLRRLKNKLGISIFILMAVIVSQLVLHLPLNSLFKKQFYQEEPWAGDVSYMLTRIPKNASVATQNNLIPHLSARKNIYILWNGQKDFRQWLRYDQTDYLLFNASAGQPANNFWGLPLKQVKEAVANMTRSNKIQLVDRRGEVYLYKKT